MGEVKAEASRVFRAMNTDVAAVIAADESRRAEAEVALADVESIFTEVEAALSRFRPSSELSTLNGAAGRAFRCSPFLFRVVVAALEAAADTGGLFDSPYWRRSSRAATTAASRCWRRCPIGRPASPPVEPAPGETSG